MDQQNGDEQSPLPIDFNGSLDPSQLPNVTLGNHSLMASQSEIHTPLGSALSGAGRRSPVKTIKEYNQQVSDLTKENFNLKLRIYHLEERMEQQYGDEQDVFKTNIELKVTVDHLKDELSEKQIYLRKAAQAVSTMTVHHQQAEEAIRQQSMADRQQEMDKLKKALDKAVQDCGRSQKQAEEATKELETMENGLKQAQKINEELSEKMEAAQGQADMLDKKLKDSDRMIDGLKNDVSNLHKQLDRKDRDMHRLSVCFDDKSLIESTISILEPQHLQDKYEDQLEAVEKLKKKIIDLEDDLGSKDYKIKGMQKELEAQLKQLDDKTLALAKCQKTIGVLMNNMRETNKNKEEREKKFKAMQSEVNELRQSVDKAANEKSQLVNDSMMIQENNDYLHQRVDEYRKMAEGFMQGLGKKEGEISGFQEQLKKAMEALTNSGTAVEELQMQLKKERAEFEHKLRNQARLFEDCKGPDSNDDVAALKQQMAELKKTMADQNVLILEQQRGLTDLERQNKKMREKEGDLLDERGSHERKISLLEREIHTLRLELERKDMRIGNLQTNTVHIGAPNQSGTKLDVNVQLLPMGVMDDMRLLVDNLKQELLTVKVLQNSMQNLMSNGPASETLKPEIEAVHKIYQQLEHGVMKNSQIHKSLLTSLQENASSKPYNSNTSTNHHSYHSSLTIPGSPGLMMEDEIDGPAPPPSSPTGRGAPLMDETLPEKDNSLETLGNKLEYLDLEPSVLQNNSRLSPHAYGRRSPGDQSLNLDHSLTDDAKEGHLRHPDYNAFQHFFEPRMQDRASLYRLDAQEDNRLPYFGSSPGQRPNVSGVTANHPSPRNDLIDLSEGNPSPENNRDSFSNLTRRESKESNNSFKNVTLRSDTFSDRFSNDRFSNVSVRNSRGTGDISVDKILIDVSGRNSGVSKAVDKTGNKLVNGLDANSTHDPDVVKSTIGFRKSDGVAAQSKDNSTVRVSDAQEQQNRLQGEKDYDTSADGQGQISPSKESGNQNNSGIVSRFLSPQSDQLEPVYLTSGHTPTSDRRNLMAQLQADLIEAVRQKEDADSEIQNLQDKLEATENTVRHLSRKMKSYHHTMEQAGINPLLKRRSSSDLSLGQGDGPFRRGSNDSNKDKCEETCPMSMDNTSVEKGRDVGIRPQSLMKDMGAMSHSLIVMSPTGSSKGGNRMASPTSTCISSPERMSNQVDDRHSVSPLSPLQDFTLNQAETHQNTSLNNTTHLHYQRPSSDRTINNSSVLNLTKGDWSGRNGENEPEDPTFTSLLVTDYASLHRRLTILSKSFMNNTSTVSGDQSFNDATLSVDKLQSRLAHLERIILMQKEEITVYESLLTSMGVPVLPGDYQGNDNGATEESKESLLRQHLVEIRKLRQRLENIDLSNDPDQLLIFHTHTQQRITQQEHVISRLQQTLIEKEEFWNRDAMEMEHRMNREKAMLAQRLDVTQEELKNQRVTLGEQEKVIQNLKENLQLKDQVAREIGEENEKLKQEKSEINEDLVKREKEFLDMEKTMFKLELAKEEVDSQKNMIKAELEENEKQVMKLKCDMDHFKESCRSLREALRHKEDSLHEQVQCLKKMAQEKTGMDEKLTRLHIELEELQADAEKMKLDVEEKKILEEDYSHLKEEFIELRIILDEKVSQHQQVLGQKEELENEVTKLNDEMTKVKADSERTIVDVRKNTEFQLEIKQKELREEVYNLRTTLEKRRNLESELRIRATSLESNLREEEVEKAKIEDELNEKAEKVKKRDRQCQFVLDRFGKLEAAYKKQSQLLKDKNEVINSMKKQMQLYDSTLSNLSKDTEQGTLRELFHELMLTKTQVASLLARLEGNSNQVMDMPEINLDAFGTTPGATASSNSNSTTTTVTTNETTTTETTQHTTTVNSNTTTACDLISIKSFGGSLTDLTADPGISNSCNSSFANLDPHNTLCAILKLEHHEKASKQTGECLVSLSGVEARIEDRLKAYKAKSVTESLDYSTLREAGMACHQMRTCLNDISRIISLAWITELPSAGDQSRDFDPETEKLRGELSELQSKYSVLETTLKEQQGKLNVSKQRQKDWEHSVCRQLLRTSQDLEQAKENLDLSQGILKQVNISTNANTNAGNTSTKTGDSGKKSKATPRLSSQPEMN